MKNKKNQRENQPAGRLPYRFVLPRDLGLVRTWAHVGAIECAYTIIRDKSDLNEIGLASLGFFAGRHIIESIYEGKQGTNDEALYHQTYLEHFNAMYPQAREALISGRLVIDPAWTEEQRLSILVTFTIDSHGSFN